MKILKEMPIGEVVAKYPETVSVFQRHGLPCVGCFVASFETIEEGAALHGIELEALLKDLNNLVKNKKEGKEKKDK